MCVGMDYTGLCAIASIGDEIISCSAHEVCTYSCHTVQWNLVTFGPLVLAALDRWLYCMGCTAKC